VKYFILATLSILLFYAVATFAFEIPDENAHFSSLTYLANAGRMPTVTDKDNLSLEEMGAERVFGIVEGQNRYSYHPEYRVEQIPGPLGKYEELIHSLNTPANRRTYQTFQAATYPPLYYWLTLPFYSLVSGQDILTRLFVSRFSSVILTTLTVLVAYFVGQDLFKRRSSALTLALMTLFYPMTSYVGAGVNSDNLHNLLFAVATLLVLKLIYTGYRRELSLAIGTVIGLDLLTKPQAYILFPVFVLAIVIRWRSSEWRSILSSLGYVLVPILLIAGWQEIPKFWAGNPYVAQAIRYGGIINFRLFIAGYVHTNLAEMPVWYWGVFKWFGIILPRPLWWVGTRLFGLSLLGALLGFYRDLRAHRWSRESRFVLFALGANFIYAAALFWFDWQFYQQFGRSLGLQARYYMPLLITQMSFMFLGLTNLGWNKKVKEWIRCGIILFFLGLQLTAFYLQLKSYYDLWPLPTFFNQLSQYKPIFAKGAWWYLWFPLYFAGIITTTIIALKKDHQ
jgi:4-amino-4-deoxy-L-arabinose transferase-like glycosyltransferase